MTERIAHDAYYTPDDVAARLVRVLVEHHLPPSPRVCEPSVGGGAFARALRAACGPHTHLTGVDIRPDAEGLRLCDVAVAGDYLALDLPRVAWTIGNPPFTHAEAHVRHALSRSSRGVAFLLRLAFLESEKRAAFWAEHPASAVYVLSKRPSFVGGGTDSCAYALFVWDKMHVGPTTLHVLGTESTKGETP